MVKLNLNAFGLKPSWYTRLVDGGKLPAIELDGAVHVGSIPIMRLLDETFPHSPRMVPPAGSDEADDYDRYMYLEKEMVSGMYSHAPGGTHAPARACISANVPTSYSPYSVLRTGRTVLRHATGSLSFSTR